MTKQNAEPASAGNRFDALKPRVLNRMEKETVVKLALSVLADRHRSGRVLGSPSRPGHFSASSSLTASTKCSVRCSSTTGTA